MMLKGYCPKFETQWNQLGQIPKEMGHNLKIVDSDDETAEVAEQQTKKDLEWPD